MSKGCWMLKLDTKSALSHHLDLQAAHPNKDSDERYTVKEREIGRVDRMAGGCCEMRDAGLTCSSLCLPRAERSWGPQSGRARRSGTAAGR